MTLIAAILGTLAIVLLVPSTLVFVQTLLAALPFRLRGRVVEQRPPLAVLVPAHNEAAGIAETLRAISGQLRPGDRLLVVADNCSDDTARIATLIGAEVIQRAEPQRRGKGFALDFGIRHLASRPPDIVVVVDADCILARTALDELAGLAAAEQRPAQALYLTRAPIGAAALTRVAEFAWLVKNYVRPLGYHRLGLPCHLMGTGMAFPWALLERASLAYGNIVEDLTLGLELARRGAPARFCPRALVTSYFPKDAAIVEQRRRWEHGHLATIVHDGIRLLGTAMFRLDVKLFALALDLCVPPLTLLALILAAVLAAGLALYGVSDIAWPAIIAGWACGVFAAAVLVAWMRFGRQVISLRGLAYAGLYALWKIPLYARFLTRRQIEWIRSRREGE